MKKLSNEDLVLLGRKGNEDAEELLFKRNEPFLRHMVRKMRTSDNDFDDALAAARLGLFKAYRSYKHGSDAKFITFASICIRNEISMVFRGENRYRDRVACSLNDIVYNEDNTGIAGELGEILVDPDSDFSDNLIDTLNTEGIVSQLLHRLSPRDKKMLALYTEGKTQTEISREIGISQSYVARRLLGIKRKLMQRLNLSEWSNKPSNIREVNTSMARKKDSYKYGLTREELGKVIYALQKYYPILPLSRIAVQLKHSPSAISKVRKDLLAGKLTGEEPIKDGVDEILGGTITIYRLSSEELKKYNGEAGVTESKTDEKVVDIESKREERVETDIEMEEKVVGEARSIKLKDLDVSLSCTPGQFIQTVDKLFNSLSLRSSCNTFRLIVSDSVED